MTRALIFDMDGTLFQTHYILGPALEETFAHLRAQRLWQGATPLAQYEAIMGVPLPVVWQTLCPLHSPAQHKLSNAFFQEALIRQIEQEGGALYPGVTQLFEQLAGDYALFIASNGHVPYLQAIVTHYELTTWLTGVYSIDCIASGNKSELVAKLMREQHVTSGFVIGDRASDIQAAAQNGLTSIGVRFHFAQEHELQQADYVVDSLADVVAIVQKRPSRK